METVGVPVCVPLENLSAISYIWGHLVLVYCAKKNLATLVS
jgi:hypothetical protein